MESQCLINITHFIKTKNHFKGIVDDHTSSLIPNLPTMCNGKTCEDSVMSLKLVTTKRKKVATTTEISKRVTRGNIALDNAHATPITHVALATFTRRVTRGEGGSPKVVTWFAKKKGQKGTSKEVLKLLVNSPAKSIDSRHKRIKK
jgi:hypothetical protein